jgi:hypothetical protein
MKIKEKMIDVYKRNVNIERLLNDESEINISNESSDFISYPEFLKYFKDLKVISKHNVIIGINFTYGWMPTIFDFRSNNFNVVVDILNKAKLGEILSVGELEILRKCFNNSLVGTSKLLHFINPGVFAIWDSRVFRYLTKQKSHSYRMDNCRNYLDYLEFIKYLTDKPDYNRIHNSIITKVGYNMTKFRTAELIMYLKSI